MSALTIAPVKGMRLAAVDAIEVGAAGAAGDRAFFVRGRTGRIASTARHPALTQIVPTYDRAASRLALTFPDGTVVDGEVVPGDPVETAFYDSRRVAGRVVRGPFAEAISKHLGRPVQLVLRDAAERGGDDAPLTLMSEASLGAVAEAGGWGGAVDGRRFRMTLTIEGVEAWEEHGWGGRRLAVGDALVEVDAPVVRCAVTTRDPDDGHRDLPVPRTLAQLRGKRDVTFGVWLGVVRGGTVHIGDPVEPSG
ncbi:MAG TPA: MOSC N-terminal beta barrel domain-containing protein [Solirubrobacteraceae bacterium]